MGAAALAGGGGAPLGPRGWGKEGGKGGSGEEGGLLALVGLTFPYSSPWAVLVDFGLPPLYTWGGGSPQHTSSTAPPPQPVRPSPSRRPSKSPPSSRCAVP